MALRFNDIGFCQNTIGMPDAHAEAFKRVAQRQRCVIICRAVGPTCRQLLQQGYDTKGFRIHGKSCDWGPMAGFVMRDPRLNKAGMDKADYNRREHNTALNDTSNSGWNASTTPLRIYEARRVWLQAQGLIAAAAVGGRYEGVTAHRTGIAFHYSLIQEPGPPGVWGVYLDKARNRGKFEQERGTAVFKYHPKYSGHLYEPLLAMTNPVTHRSWPGDDFRNAVTGDYDLFAIWTLEEDYEPDGDDRRILGTQEGWSERHLIEDRLERYFTTQGQGTKIGNITNRIYEVCQLLNSDVGTTTAVDGGVNWGPFPGRMVCWHSDESARPFVKDVDLSVIAFAPSGLEVGIELIADFEQFIVMCIAEGFRVTLAEGWTLAPTAADPNRLGQNYRHLVPQWQRDPLGRPLPWRIPQWYNE